MVRNRGQLGFNLLFPNFEVGKASIFWGRGQTIPMRFSEKKITIKTSKEIDSFDV